MENKELEKIIKSDCDEISSTIIIGAIETLEKQVRFLGGIPLTRNGDKK